VSDCPSPDRRSLRRRYRAGDPGHGKVCHYTMRHRITSFQLLLRPGKIARDSRPDARKLFSAHPSAVTRHSSSHGRSALIRQSRPRGQRAGGLAVPGGKIRRRTQITWYITRPAADGDMFKRRAVAGNPMFTDQFGGPTRSDAAVPPGPHKRWTPTDTT
jgi:hypothetical protein